jgi:hypothetical protein
MSSTLIASTGTIWRSSWADSAPRPAASLVKVSTTACFVMVIAVDPSCRQGAPRYVGALIRPERLDRQLAHQRVVLDHQDPGHRAEIPILFSSLLEANVRANE